MKAITAMAATALLTAVFAFTAHAQDKDVNGTWTASLVRGSRTGTATLNLHVSGNQVTGTVNDPSGQTLQIENGKLEANQLTFDVSAREHGRKKSIHFFGDVEENGIALHNQSNGKPGVTMTFHRSN